VSALWVKSDVSSCLVSYDKISVFLVNDDENDDENDENILNYRRRD